MAYKNIEDRRTYHRQYMKERRDLYRKLHLCTECGKKDAYTMVGHPRCFDHTHYRHNSPIEYIPEQKPKEEPKDTEGRCHLCGKPYMDGVGKWTGEPIKLCERCYQNLCKSSEKGRKAYQERHGETWGQTQYNRFQRKKESQNSEKSLRLSI